MVNVTGFGVIPLDHQVEDFIAAKRDWNRAGQTLQVIEHVLVSTTHDVIQNVVGCDSGLFTVRLVHLLDTLLHFAEVVRTTTNSGHIQTDKDQLIRQGFLKRLAFWNVTIFNFCIQDGVNKVAAHRFRFC